MIVKRIFVIINFVLVCFDVFAENFEQTIHLTANDFKILTENSGESYIYNMSESITYQKDSLGYCLPILTRNFIIKDCDIITSVDYEVKYTRYKDGVKLGKDLRVSPTTVLDNSFESNNLSSFSELPSSNVNTVDNFILSIKDDVPTVYFSISPFRYDEKNKSLDFASDIKVKIKYEPLKQNGKRAVVPPEVASLISKSISSSFVNAQDYQDDEDRIDYAIITNNELKNEFQRLADWKEIKGLKTIILSTEDIYSSVSGEDNQSKIKQTLYWLNLSYGLKYVLLGGDNNIIPVRYCKVKVEMSQNGDVKEEEIPTDAFYSCLGGTLSWDENNNGIYGESSDNINLTPTIYVSRVPVRTKEHARAIIDKTLQYEQNPIRNGWNNKVLMIGSAVSQLGSNESQSDAELLAEMLYDSAFTDLWDGTRVRLFDTFVEPNIINYKHDWKTLQMYLSDGPRFVDAICHGGNWWWNLIKNNTYTAYIASKLVSSKPMLVTTIACNTNRFDNDSSNGQESECLSEAFIRNPNSGVFAYIGSSREGWIEYFSFKPTMMGSIGYEREFYKSLFDSNNSCKSFGYLVAMAKQKRISFANSPVERWLQFSINPIGDPEMYIFPLMPKNLPGGKISISSSAINISSQMKDCSVCVTFIDSNKNRLKYIYNDSGSINLTPVSKEGYIYIQKPGYIPFWCYFNNGTIYLENNKLKGLWSFEGFQINTGSHNSNSGAIELHDNGVLKIKSKGTVIAPGTVINKGSILEINK